MAKTASRGTARGTPPVRPAGPLRPPRRLRAATTLDDGDSVVVYIHGIGRHLKREELKLEWDLALFGRDRGAHTAMAYWSDIVHPPAAATLAARAGDAERLDVDHLLAQTNLSARQAEKAREFVVGMLRSYGLDDETTNRGPRKKVIPLPGFMREPIARAFLKRFIVDTATYFFDPAKRAEIRTRLRDVLASHKRRRITLVAHSQGSIVSVEVLAKMPELEIAKLVTIGSPLGLQEVQDFLDLQPGKPPFYTPSCVERWDNFADPLDPVALDKGLGGEFILAPADRRPFQLDSPIVDRIIVNEKTFRLRTFNPHSAAGYLAHPKVRNSVYETTHFNALSRFVLARDVAEALSREERQPVLIEVLEPGYRGVDENDAAFRAREKKEPATLEERIAKAATDLKTLVGDSKKAARIDTLRRFVAAHLTAGELRHVAANYREFNVYTVWRSASKTKLLHRSRRVLQADAALESYKAGGAGVRWAVLDTGIAAAHKHFEGRIGSIWDCTRPGPPVPAPKEVDRDGHGSHVAGIIAGRSTTKDGVEISGVAPDAELVVYKVLNDRGEGEDAWIIKALDHIAAYNENYPNKAIHGLNLSLGGAYDATVYGCGFTPICQELRRLWRSGVLVVVACGNEGQLEVQTSDGGVEINSVMSIGDPANLEDCIAVGSVHADKPHLYGISAFSSRGPTADGRCKPDVVAPGESITSVNARHRPGRLHRVESGTSMAAPHVSGLLAAFLSVRREYLMRPDEVKQVLLATCTDLGRDRYHQGRGIPNLMKMLLSV